MQAHNRPLESFLTLMGKLSVILKTKATMWVSLLSLFFCSFGGVSEQIVDGDVCAPSQAGSPGVPMRVFLKRAVTKATVCGFFFFSFCGGRDKLF